MLDPSMDPLLDHCIGSHGRSPWRSFGVCYFIFLHTISSLPYNAICPQVSPLQCILCWISHPTFSLKCIYFELFLSLHCSTQAQQNNVWTFSNSIPTQVSRFNNHIPFINHFSARDFFSIFACVLSILLILFFSFSFLPMHCTFPFIFFHTLYSRGVQYLAVSFEGVFLIEHNQTQQRDG